MTASCEEKLTSFQEKQTSTAEKEQERERLQAEIDQYKSKCNSLEQEIEIKLNEVKSAAEKSLEEKDSNLKSSLADLQKKLQTSVRSESKLKLELKSLKEQQVTESSQAILMMDKKIAQIQQKLENKSPRGPNVVCSEKSTQVGNFYLIKFTDL